MNYQTYMLQRENTNKALLIRADASTIIGTGHVMRCLALAQAWQENEGPVIFALAHSTPSLLARLEAEQFYVVSLAVEPGSDEDAQATIHLAQQQGATWIVADGYHFDSGYQLRIKQAGLHLLVIDDYGHADHYYADIVLNQNISASDSLYTNREPSTRLLLGTRYVLLRREFWQWQGWQREIPDIARKVLVTMGGGDPENVTFKVIQALQQVELVQFEAIVVVGGSNPHRAMLQQSVHDTPHIKLVQDVTNMPELMAWADVAIAAGGSTNWELALLGVPTIILVLAENQRPIAEHLHAHSVAVNLGWHYEITPEDIHQTFEPLLSNGTQRSAMVQSGQDLVDGYGSYRVIEALNITTGTGVCA